MPSRSNTIRVLLGKSRSRALALAALVSFGASACASTPRTSTETGTTNLTSADAYTPGTVELYVARQTPTGAPALACPSNLPPNVEFALRSAELVKAEGTHLDQWAACLNRPAMQHATVVLIGGDDPASAPGLFVQRAQHIKSALVARGIDPSRIVIGASNASREGGAYASATGVRLELTHDSTLRSFPPQDLQTRYGLR